MANQVHVVGTGTIGAPLTFLLARHRRELGIDRVTFHKNTPRATDVPLVRGLVAAGAQLVAARSSVAEFKRLGLDPGGASEEALADASVVVEATPDDVALEAKPRYQALQGPKGFLAQGSETGFGLPYALGVNDDVLARHADRFVQIVSCNTHAISALVRALSVGPGVPLQTGRVVCIRRTTDVGQAGAGDVAPAVSKHGSPYGTHHAEDVVRLYETTGRRLDLFSSALKTPTQYMHTLWFSFTMGRDVAKAEVEKWIDADPYLATTTKRETNTVFNTGRELGPFGRILNQAVVVSPTVHVKGREITGFAFTPQDGNVLLSNVGAVCRFLHPDDWKRRVATLDAYLFDSL